MVGLDSRTETPGRRDPVTRAAARWATAVAVPVGLLAGWLLLSSTGAGPGADPTAAPSAPRVQSTAPVSVLAPALGGPAATACRTLVAALPERVRDLPRRPVTTGTGQNAAYGDPPITLACGVAVPSVAPTDLVFRANDICWHGAQAGGAAVLTTVDRTVPVRVTVPNTYAQALQWTNEFSAAVSAASPASTAALPSGCTE